MIFARTLAVVYFVAAQAGAWACYTAAEQAARNGAYFADAPGAGSPAAFMLALSIFFTFTGMIAVVCGISAKAR